MGLDRGGARPSRPLTLLLQACLLPEAQAALAWHEWQVLRPFDEVSGAEVRLLAPLSVRLRTLDPGSPLLPRIAGIARARWTMAQLVLRAAGRAIGRLAAAGIPVLLFDAAALHAEGVGPEARREVEGVDIMVPAAALADAGALLMAEGWIAADGASAGFLRAVAPGRNSVRLLEGPHGEIRLWKLPFGGAQNGEGSEAIWAAARQAALAGQSLLVPDSTHAVLIALARGGEGGDWALEAVQRCRREAIDWPGLVEAARCWDLSAAIAPRLDFLAEALALAVDPAIRRKLARDRPRFRVFPGWSRMRAPSLPDDGALLPIRRARRIRNAQPVRDAGLALVQSLDGGGRLRLAFPAEALGQRFQIEVGRGDAIIALIRGRVRAPVHRVTLPLPAGATLTFDSRPIAIDRPGFGQLPEPTSPAVPFRVWRESERILK